MDGCGDGCTSVILPGGLELARQVFPSLNHSMFDGDLFDKAETIRIDNAPAFILTFQNSTWGGSLTVNPEVDCVFAGQQINDTLQMCVRQDGDGIAVGKSRKQTPLTSYTLGEKTSLTEAVTIFQGGRAALKHSTQTTPATAIWRGPPRP